MIAFGNTSFSEPRLPESDETECLLRQVETDCATLQSIDPKAASPLTERLRHARQEFLATQENPDPEAATRVNQELASIGHQVTAALEGGEW